MQADLVARFDAFDARAAFQFAAVGFGGYLPCGVVDGLGHVAGGGEFARVGGGYGRFAASGGDAAGYGVEFHHAVRADFGGGVRAVAEIEAFGQAGFARRAAVGGIGDVGGRRRFAAVVFDGVGGGVGGVVLARGNGDDAFAFHVHRFAGGVAHGVFGHADVDAAVFGFGGNIGAVAFDGEGFAEFAADAAAVAGESERFFAEGVELAAVYGVGAGSTDVAGGDVGDFVAAVVEAV